MTEVDLQVFLEELNLSSFEMPVYQSRLRNAMLVFGENQRTVHTSFWVDCKNVVQRTFKTRRITLIGSGAALAAAAILGLVLLSSQSSSFARAEGLVNDCVKTMQALSPEAKAQFEKDFGADPIDFLEQAKRAKDLEIITKVEYEAELIKHGGPTSFSIGSETHHFALTVNKYLRYTNQSEKIVLLGLLDNDALVFAVTFTSEHRTDIRLGEIENLG